MKKKLFTFFVFISFPLAVGAKSSFPPSFTEYTSMRQSFDIFISEMEKNPNLYYRLEHFGFGEGDDEFENETRSVGIVYFTPKDCTGILQQSWISNDCNEYSCEPSKFYMQRCPE